MTEPPTGPERVTSDDEPTGELSIEGIAATVRTCTLCALSETRTNAVP